MKTFEEYESLVNSLATYPSVGYNLVYPALGLCGEAGELAEKIKKLWRNKETKDGANLTKEEREAIVKEAGDVLWYLAAVAREIGEDLETIASVNAAKLLDRHARGVIKSEGDNR